MKKRLISIITLLFLISGFFSGCINNNSVENQDFDSGLITENLISAPSTAYFDEELEFNAMNINAQDKIKTLYWDFGDGFTAEGGNVKHSYSFLKEFEIEYPVVYTVTLLIVDDKQTVTTDHQIKLYPKKYTFYFDIGKTSFDVPISGYEKTGTNSIIKPREVNKISYQFEKPINVSACDLEITLYLEKPFSLVIRKVTVSFYDAYNNEVKSIEKNLFLNNLWRLNNIQIQGSLDKQENIKSIEILFYGFSISENIKILYGTGTPSNICFYSPTI